MTIKKCLLLVAGFGLLALSPTGLRAQASPAPSNPTQVLEQKAQSLEQRGRIDLAAKVWQQVLLVDPKDPEALAGMARFQRQSEAPPPAGGNSAQPKPAKAGPRAETADIRRGFDASQRAKLSEAANLSNQHNPDAAMKLYKEVFGDRPPEGDWSIAYYETLAATADGTPAAITSLRELSKRYPSDTRYSISVARLLTYNPHTRAEGVKMLESIPSTDAGASLVRASWRQALVWEHGNPAFEASLHNFQSRYQDPDIEKEFGEVQASKSATEVNNGRDEQAAYQALSDNDVTRAEELFEKLRSNPAGTTAGLIGLGYVRMKQQNFAGAVDAFEEAKSRLTAPNTKVDEALTTSRFWRQMKDATQDLDQDRVDSALASFQQALVIQPNNPDALGGLAGTLMKAGQPATAVPVFEKWTQASPDDRNAWLGYLRALQQSGDAAGTIAAAKQMPATVRAKSLDDAEFLLPLSEAYRATGNADEAQRLLQQVLQGEGSAKASPEAQAQIALVLTQTGSYDQATNIYINLLQKDPQKLDLWEGLIGTLHQANKDAEALSVGAKMPEDLYNEALAKPDFVVMMSSVYEAQDQLGPAHRMLEAAMQQGTADGQTAPVQLQLQIAGLWLREKQYDKSLDLFGQILGHYPENIEAWRGALAAYHESNQDARAIAMVDRASDLQRRRLEADPDVLSLLAFAHSAQGDHELALRLVRQAVARYQVTHRPLPVDLELQASWIFLDAGDSRSLYPQLRALTARTDLNVTQRNSLTDLWIAWSLKRADAEAAAGNFTQSLSLLTSARRAFPEDPKIHTAFATTLVRAGYARQGFEQFRSWNFLNAQPDDYAAAIASAISTREFKTAETWLSTSLQLFPADSKLLMAGAKLAVARGDYSRANRYYQQALAHTPGGKGTGAAAPFADAADTGNVDKPTAMRNLALALVPDNAQSGAASNDSTGSDHTDPLDSFLSDLSPSATNQPNANTGAPDSLAFPDAPAHQALEDLSHTTPTSGVDPVTLPTSKDPVSATGDPLSRLLGNSNGDQTPPPAPSQRQNKQPAPQSSPKDRSSNARQADPSVAASYFLDPSPSNQQGPSDEADALVPQPNYNAQANYTPQQPPLPDVAQAFVDSAPSSSSKSQAVDPRDDVHDQIAGMTSQLSPFAGAEAILHARSGQAGFDKLISQQTNLEASTTFGQSLRMTFVAQPIVLDAGTPTGSSNLQLGTLAVGSTFGPMGASGIGGEVQLATQNFGARLGITPEGFLVRNFTGEFDLKPAGGPIQITASRAPVTDTLLSYAGIRDPGTGQVWGGVIADNISGMVSSGSAASGFYGGVGYQYITGTNVETNKAINGTLGAYWRILSRPSGSLTIGLNFSGMHYNDDLRYFTLGQGGYFSPQVYLLFNVPFHYGGVYQNRFEYSVDASLGSQHFQEDASPYYPTNPPPTTVRTVGARQVPTSLQSYYAAQISTGANYSMIFKGGYHLSENWVLGGFLNLNNTQNYASQTAGFFMRYQFHAGRMISTSYSGYLPDWNAIQPLAMK